VTGTGHGVPSLLTLNQALTLRQVTVHTLTAIELSQIVGAVPSRRLGLRLLFQVFSRREGTAPTNPDPTYPLI